MISPGVLKSRCTTAAFLLAFGLLLHVLLHVFATCGSCLPECKRFTPLLSLVVAGVVVPLRLVILVVLVSLRPSAAAGRRRFGLIFLSMFLAPAPSISDKQRFKGAPAPAGRVLLV